MPAPLKEFNTVGDIGEVLQQDFSAIFFRQMIYTKSASKSTKK